jgi:tetratricopeptide (TPR) repeat protein
LMFLAHRMSIMLKRHHVFGLVFVIIFWAYPLFSQQDPVTIYTQRADEFLLSGRLEQALAEYEKVLKLDPNNAYALHQTNIIRQKLGLKPLSVDDQASAGASPVEDKYPPLPPRDYSKILPRLGAEYRDENNGFSIQPPEGWWMDKYSPHFAVKFTDRGYEAFIFINIITLEGPAIVDDNFKKFVELKNLQVESLIPGYHALYQNLILFQGRSAIEVRATFMAGTNLVRMTTFYIPAGKKVFMITTACNDELLNVWKPVFAATLSTFKTFGG